MAVYSLFCPSPCALLQFSFFSDVWYLPHFVEGLGRIKKREAGVEAMFQDFCFFLCLGPQLSVSCGIPFCFVLCFVYLFTRCVLFVTM